MADRPRNKMPAELRAKQFMPFAALKGYGEALAAKEKTAAARIELSEEMMAELDRKMHLLEKGSMICAAFYYKGGYQKKTGLVAGIDTSRRILQVADVKIPFDDIVDITFP